MLSFEIVISPLNTDVLFNDNKSETSILPSKAPEISALTHFMVPLITPAEPNTSFPFEVMFPSMAPSTRRSPSVSISHTIFVPAPIILGSLFSTSNVFAIISSYFICSKTKLTKECLTFIKFSELFCLSFSFDPRVTPLRFH
jgi:hypothetical protein